MPRLRQYAAKTALTSPGRDGFEQSLALYRAGGNDSVLEGYRRQAISQRRKIFGQCAEDKAMLHLQVDSETPSGPAFCRSYSGGAKHPGTWTRGHLANVKWIFKSGFGTSFA
jgi:hypothetical protein